MQTKHNELEFVPSYDGSAQNFDSLLCQSGCRMDGRVLHRVTMEFRTRVGCIYAYLYTNFLNMGQC